MSKHRRVLVLNRLQTRSERMLTRELAKLFLRSTRDAAKLAEQGLDPTEMSPSLRKGLETILTRAYWRTARLTSDEMFRQLSAIRSKGAEDIFEESALAWIQKWVAEKVVTLHESFMGTVRSVIEESFTEGLGQEETARAIRKKVGGEYSQWKAARIARTETAAAANMGTHEAAKSTDVDTVKEWVSVDDPRTRPSHAAADGQIRGMDEPFSVGDYQLQFPGDPSGPAGQVINCRCVVLYHPVLNGEILR